MADAAARYLAAPRRRRRSHGRPHESASQRRHAGRYYEQQAAIMTRHRSPLRHIFTPPLPCHSADVTACAGRFSRLAMRTVLPRAAAPPQVVTLAMPPRADISASAAMREARRARHSLPMKYAASIFGGQPGFTGDMIGFTPPSCRHWPACHASLYHARDMIFIFSR